MIDLIKAVDPWIATAIVLAILWIAFRVINGSWRFWHLAIGVDRRYSSSLFHGLAWTVVVVASYVAMFAARVHAGSTAPLGSIPPNVLTALGLAVGTTVAAAGIMAGNDAKHPGRKRKAPEAELSLASLVQDDEGHPNLPKAQLMAWTLISLAVYIVASADAVAHTLATTDLNLLPKLPDIDQTLLVLSGIGQASYIATKVVSPPKATTGAADPGTGSRTAAASARVRGFLPSVNGLHFINSFPHEPELTIDLPGLASIPVGDASNGVCGGMVFTVRDVFQTPGLAPVATTTTPAPGTPLFRYIVDRLIASFDIGNLGFLRYYDWMLTPDGDTSLPLGLMPRRGLAWKTIVEEWPARIRPELDAGRLCCLGLVTVAGANPGDLAKNHQVMAYGYDLDASANLTLRIYDPNTPPDRADQVTIKLSLANPEQATTIDHTVAINEPIRGFFKTEYAYRDPTGHLG